MAIWGWSRLSNKERLKGNRPNQGKSMAATSRETREPSFEILKRSFLCQEREKKHIVNSKKTTNNLTGS